MTRGLAGVLACTAAVCAACSGDGGGGGGSIAFGDPIAISDGAADTFVPAIAARGGDALVTWHQFEDGTAKIAYVLVDAGVPGELRAIPAVLDTAAQLRPSVAATVDGWVLAWQERDGDVNVAKAVWLDTAGEPLDAPEVVSSSGATVHGVRVASVGDDVAFSWTDGDAHHIALRGPGETLPATPVGTTLESTGVLNAPRIALAADGTLHLGYRDGGETAGEWDVRLVTRPRGGGFSSPVNVSRTPGLLSDEVSLALDGDRLHLAWAEQDPSGAWFDAVHAMRDGDGNVSDFTLYAGTSQQDGVWGPSVNGRGAAAWSLSLTTPVDGTLWFAPGPGRRPEPLFDGLRGGFVALAGEDPVHLAWTSAGPPRIVHYARGE